MASGFTVGEILEATGGKLLAGTVEARIRSISLDTRQVTPGEFFLPLKGEKYDGHDFLEEAFALGANGALVSVSRASGWEGKARRSGKCLVAVPDTLEALQALGAWRRRRSHVSLVAITGSNGKTTTKDMLELILSAKLKVVATEGNLNNQVGVPVTLLALGDEHDAAIVEMGMNAPGEIARLAEIARPDVGVITNIGTAHLGFFSGREGIARAKAELLEVMGEKGIAVLNRDDDLFSFLKGKVRGKLLTFGMEKESDFWAEEISLGEERTSFRLNGEFPVSLNIPGRHNLANALAAVAGASALGLGPEEAARSLEGFKASPLRTQIERRKGLVILNDAYNANPDSMRLALELLQQLDGGGRKVAVLGDMLELGDFGKEAHRELGERVARSGVDLLVAVGGFAEELREAALRAGLAPGSAYVCTNSEEASDLLGKLVRRGDTILVKGSRLVGMEEVAKSLGEG